MSSIKCTVTRVVMRISLERVEVRRRAHAGGLRDDRPYRNWAPWSRRKPATRRRMTTDATASAKSNHPPPFDDNAITKSTRNTRRTSNAFGLNCIDSLLISASGGVRPQSRSASLHQVPKRRPLHFASRDQLNAAGERPHPRVEHRHDDAERTAFHRNGSVAREHIGGVLGASVVARSRISSD